MELQLKVHGMVCGTCSSRVQEALQARPSHSAAASPEARSSGPSTR